MRSVDEHAALVAELLPATPVQPTPLAMAAGLVLGADLVASLDLPPFVNSAMDGYAVRAADLPAARIPIELVVSQDIPAGKTHVVPLQPGTAARIMTGAPVPNGADSIVPVEHTDAGTVRVRIDQAPEPGRHLRATGSDVANGTVVLTAGTVLGPTQIGLAAALGRSTVPVRRPLRVLVLSTGSELVVPGNPLLPGQIYESNAPMLAAAINAVGALSTVAHFVADDVDEFRSAFADATGDVDLVVTSGGVSAGAYEVVKDAFTDRGVRFAKVAMQPGMPQGCGLVDTGGRQLPVVTLPGNPVSSFVSFEVFLRPAIKAAMGHPAAHQHRPARMMPLAESLTSIAGKRQFRRGQLDQIAGSVRAFGGPGSHLLGWLAGADCLLVIPEDTTELAAGESIEVWDLI
ncbi:MAG: molybdopterin molybdotransferase MoeA [Actinomycetota bacterium]|nr:molybdopterin molybdotransferase MoeA [Actinomycetota bacterium]